MFSFAPKFPITRRLRMNAHSFENIIQRPASLEMEWLTFGPFQLVLESRIKEFKEMMKHKLFDPNVKDGNGDALIFRTLAKGKLEFFKSLLDHPKINVNIKDDDTDMCSYGMTPLMKCLSASPTEEKIQICQMLLERPEIDVNVQDRTGYTALIWNMRCGHVEMLKLLMRHPGLEVNSADIHLRETALDCLLKKRPTGGKYNTYPENEHSIPHLELLFTNPGVNMKSKSVLKFWETPLFRARENTPPEFVDLVECYEKDPKLVSVQMKIKHGILTPAELFCVMNFRAERYKDAFNLPDLARFKKILHSMPLEIMMRICNLACEVDKEFISQKEIDCVMGYL